MCSEHTEHLYSSWLKTLTNLDQICYIITGGIMGTPFVSFDVLMQIYNHMHTIARP